MAAKNSSKRALENELRDLKRTPVDGFSVDLGEDGNMYTWDVRMFGPPETLYEGGYFKATMRFPQDYPYNPPAFRFKTDMFHPNIFHCGELCISILHPPGSDEMSGELPSERWNPTQSVRTILLSVVSLLSEPNDSSPANVDAAKLFRDWKRNGDKQYEARVRALVAKTEADAEADGVTVPKTLDDYMEGSKKAAAKLVQQQDDLLDYDDLYDDNDCDMGGYSDEDEEDMEEFEEEQAAGVGDNDSGMH